MYVLVLVDFLVDVIDVGVGGSCLVGCSTLAVLYGVVDIAIEYSKYSTESSYAVQCANMRKLINSVASLSQAQRNQQILKRRNPDRYR